MDLSALTTAEAMILASAITLALGAPGLYLTLRKTKSDIMANVVKAMGDLAEAQRKEIDSLRQSIASISTERDGLRKRVGELEAEVARLSGLLARRRRRPAAAKVAT